MDLFYRSTRSNKDAVKASQAILKGLAEDGGLYMPESIPCLDKSLNELAEMTYQEIAYEVYENCFLTDFTEAEFKRTAFKKHMTANLTRSRSLLLWRQMVHIFWNFFMVQLLRLKIWHFLFCPICYHICKEE